MAPGRHPLVVSQSAVSSIMPWLIADVTSLISLISKACRTAKVSVPQLNVQGAVKTMFRLIAILAHSKCSYLATLSAV